MTSPQLLLAEAERTVVLQYLCALMQGRLVCRGADERNQAAERLQHDAAKLRDLFLDLVRACLDEQMGGSLSGWVGVEGPCKTYPDVFRAWRKAFNVRRCCSP